MSSTAGGNQRLTPCPECGFGLAPGAEWCLDCGLELVAPRRGVLDRLFGPQPATRHRPGGLRDQGRRIAKLLKTLGSEIEQLRVRRDALVPRLAEARAAGRSVAALEPALRTVETALDQRGRLGARYQAAEANARLDRIENSLQLLLERSVPVRLCVEPRREILNGDTGDVRSVAFSPDGRTLATGSFDCTVLLWDVVMHRRRGEPLRGHTGRVLSVSFSPDGQTLATGSGDNSARLWDVASGRPRGEPLQGHRDHVTSVAFSPDGRTLASGSSDMTVRLWDVASGRPRGEPLRGYTSTVLSVAFSPDGRTLASGSEDHTVRLWDVASGRMRNEALRAHVRSVLSVAFSPDGQTLASGSDDGSVRLWDVATGRPRDQPLRGHTAPVLSVAFSPDGRTLASGSGDMTVRLWDVASGRQRVAWVGHAGEVRSVAFSPDGRTLASGSADRVVRLWRLPFTVPGRGPVEQAAVVQRSVAPLPESEAVRRRAADTLATALDVCACLTAKAVADLTRDPAKTDSALAGDLLDDLAALAQEVRPAGASRVEDVVRGGRQRLDVLQASALAPLVSALSAQAEGIIAGLERASASDCDRRLAALRECAEEARDLLARWEQLPPAARDGRIGRETRATLDQLRDRGLPELEDLVMARQATATAAGVQPLADSEALRQLREQRESLDGALRGPTAEATLEVEQLTATGGATADGFVAAQPDLAARAAALEAIEAEYARLQAESEVLDELGDA